MMIPPLWIAQACRRLEGWIGQTPLTEDPQLNICLKLENRRQAGSFKNWGAPANWLSAGRVVFERGLVKADLGRQHKPGWKAERGE